MEALVVVEEVEVSQVVVHGHTDLEGILAEATIDEAGRSRGTTLTKARLETDKVEVEAVGMMGEVAHHSI